MDARSWLVSVGSNSATVVRRRPRDMRVRVTTEAIGIKQDRDNQLILSLALFATTSLTCWITFPTLALKSSMSQYVVSVITAV